MFFFLLPVLTVPGWGVFKNFSSETSEVEVGSNCGRKSGFSASSAKALKLVISKVIVVTPLVGVVPYLYRSYVVIP